MAIDKADFLRKVKQLGAQGAHFQFRDVREGLGVHSEDRRTVSNMHNMLKALVAERVLEEIPGNRRRNKYFRVADEAKIRDPLHNGRVPVASGESRGAGRGIDRLTRIEQSIRGIDQRLDRIDEQLNKLAEIWL